jgi:hypothetical protein
MLHHLMLVLLVVPKLLLQLRLTLLGLLFPCCHLDTS